MRFEPSIVFHYLYGYQPMKLVNDHEDALKNLTNDETDKEKVEPDKLNDSDAAKVKQEETFVNGSNPSPNKDGKKSSPRKIRLPDEIALCVSSIPGAKFGACAVRKIPAGTWFGPFEGKLVRRSQSFEGQLSEFMWEIFHDGEVSHFLDGRNENSWMTFVRCARHKKEQNMVVFQYHGCIYYRTTREIRPGLELLVWYDNKYTQLLGLPLAWNDNRNGNGKRKTSTAPNESPKRKRGRHPLSLENSPSTSPPKLGTEHETELDLAHRKKMELVHKEINEAITNKFCMDNIKVSHALEERLHPNFSALHQMEGMPPLTCGRCRFSFHSQEVFESHRCPASQLIHSVHIPSSGAPPYITRPGHHHREHNSIIRDTCFSRDPREAGLRFNHPGRFPPQQAYHCCPQDAHNHMGLSHRPILPPNGHEHHMLAAGRPPLPVRPL